MQMMYQGDDMNNLSGCKYGYCYLGVSNCPSPYATYFHIGTDLAKIQFVGDRMLYDSWIRWSYPLGDVWSSWKKIS